MHNLKQVVTVWIFNFAGFPPQYRSGGVGTYAVRALSGSLREVPDGKRNPTGVTSAAGPPNPLFDDWRWAPSNRIFRLMDVNFKRFGPGIKPGITSRTLVELSGLPSLFATVRTMLRSNSKNVVTKWTNEEEIIRRTIIQTDGSPKIKHMSLHFHLTVVSFTKNVTDNIDVEETPHNNDKIILLPHYKHLTLRTTTFSLCDQGHTQRSPVTKKMLQKWIVSFHGRNFAKTLLVTIHERILWQYNGTGTFYLGGPGCRQRYLRSQSRWCQTKYKIHHHQCSILQHHTSTTLIHKISNHK